MIVHAEEANFFVELLQYAWLIVLGLVGIIWRKHNEEISLFKESIADLGEAMKEQFKETELHIASVKKNSVPFTMYEQNRKEVRNVQADIYKEMGTIANTLSRIEGKLDAERKAGNR